MLEVARRCGRSSGTPTNGAATVEGARCRGEPRLASAAVANTRDVERRLRAEAPAKLFAEITTTIAVTALRATTSKNSSIARELENGGGSVAVGCIGLAGGDRSVDRRSRSAAATESWQRGSFDACAERVSQAAAPVCTRRNSDADGGDRGRDGTAQDGRGRRRDARNQRGRGTWEDAKTPKPIESDTDTLGPFGLGFGLPFGAASRLLVLSASPLQSTFRIARNAFCGISTFPTCFIRFFPSFCFSRSFRFRLMSPP